MKNSFRLLLILAFVLQATNCTLIDQIRGKPKKKPVPVTQTPESDISEDPQDGEFDEFSTEQQQSQTASLPNSPAQPMLKNGIESFQANDFESAEWQFEEAINLDPNYGPAYYWLARVKHKFDQKNEALELLKKADKLVPGSALWQSRIRKFREFLLQS